MAIQLRRGDYNDFEPSQLLDGELAIVLENDPNTEDGTGTYVSYGNSNVKRLLTEDDDVEVPIASSETAGIVKPDSDSFYVYSEDGTMTLSPATDTTLGGVKISEYEAVGMQSDDHSLYVKIDGTTITTNEYGQLTVIGGGGGGSDIDPYDSDPEMDGTASAGSSDDYARGDHVHPTDTSRASASDFTSHVGDSTAHVTAAERSTWNAKASTATATTSANGLMSASDKTKLDGIESGANNYELPLMSESTRGGAKLGHGLAIEDGALGIGEVTDPTDAGPIVELTAKGWAEQDGTPSPSYPQEIRRVTGHTISGKTGRYVDVDVHGHNLASDGVKQGVYAFANGVYTSNSNYVCTELMPCEVGTSYVASLTGFMPAACYVVWFRSDGTFISNTATTKTGDGFATVAAPNGAASFGVSFNKASSASSVSPSDVTSVYVGEGHITTIPIPLPSRGWVAALPDGTADVLTLDGAGGYVWELNVKAATVSLENTVYDINNELKGAVFRNADKPQEYNTEALCDRAVRKIALEATDGSFYTNARNTVFVGDADDTIEDLKAKYDGATIYYGLATPTTESGYVSDMPTVPIHATLTTDLHDLAVRCCADSGAAEIASAWGRKYESRIAALESAVAELIASA